MAISVRARTHWVKFCLLCRKISHQFPESSAPNVFKIYQILSRLTIVRRRRRPASKQDKFLSGVNLTDLSICTPWFEGNVNQENLISIFSRSISIRSPPKLFLSYAAIKRWKIEDSYLGMLHNDPYSEYNYYGSQVYFPIASPGLSTVPYISAKVVDSASTSYRISYP